MKLAALIALTSAAWAVVLYAYVTASPAECFGAIGGGAIEACVEAAAARRAAFPGILRDPVGIAAVAIVLGVATVAMGRWLLLRRTRSRGT